MNETVMFYFAYGSNMDLAHMRRLCGWHCHVLGRATLKNYELGLDHRGYGNIRPKNEEEVKGVLFDIDQEGLDALDEFEGYPQVFDRVQVEVEDDAGEKYQAWVYTESPGQFGGKEPRMEYWERVVAGAKENNLPIEWIQKLENLMNKR